MIFFIVFPFLALGCAAFLFSAAIPKLRRFALSSSLWCVACAICLIAVVITLALIGTGIAALHGLFQRPFLGSMHFGQSSWIGWLFLGFALITTVVGATAITLLHGIVIRRFTLALFRLYLAAVSFGVGVLSCALLIMAFGEHFLLLTFPIPAVLFSILIALALSYACLRIAPQFRGSYPQRFPIVTPEEFNWKGETIS
jgi:hypothetical protein